MISAILLAAGKSTRMGGENKLIKVIKDKSLIIHSINNILNSSIEELIIVLGYQKDIIQKLINKNKKIKFTFNKDFQNGMASSINVGLNNLSKKTEAFFICLGDMPMVNSNIYNELIKHRKKKDIIVPICKNRQGNPILFNISMKQKILGIKGDIGAKKILELNKDQILNIEIKDHCVIEDFNTQKDFNSL